MCKCGAKRGKRIILKGRPFPCKMSDLGQFIHSVGLWNESLDYRISKIRVHANILMHLPGTMFECVINLYTAQHLDCHSLPSFGSSPWLLKFISLFYRLS